MSLIIIIYIYMYNVRICYKRVTFPSSAFSLSSHDSVTSVLRLNHNHDTV